MNKGKIRLFRKKTTRKEFGFLAVLAIMVVFVHCALAQRRMLHVSLYPYVPDAAAAALTLKQGFEKLHPDIIADITFNPNYYSVVPADHGVLYEDADIHTIDGVFLDDFLAAHKLAPLRRDFLSRLPAPEGLALHLASLGAEQVAIPYWMCADFLIYRKSLHGLDHLASLKQLETGLHGSGLAADMEDSGELAELYYSTVLAEARTDEPLQNLPEKPDPGAARVRPRKNLCRACRILCQAVRARPCWRLHRLFRNDPRCADGDRVGLSDRRALPDPGRD
jgi:hypothetical protein